MTTGSEIKVFITEGVKNVRINFWTSRRTDFKFRVDYFYGGDSRYNYSEISHTLQRFTQSFVNLLYSPYKRVTCLFI